VLACLLVSRIQKKRKDLRLIVSSATLDAEDAFQYFNENDTDVPDNDTAAIISLEGKAYPIGIDAMQCNVQRESVWA
jgi:ATP-dependent RNA helicase DDX35